jgi:hypothetical protein
MRLTFLALAAVLLVALGAPAAHSIQEGSPGSDAAQIGAAETRAGAVQPETGARLPGPPTWPVDPEPIARAAKTDTEPGGNDGLPWEPIAYGLAGAAVALAAAGTLVAIRRRSHRPGVAA